MVLFFHLLHHIADLRVFFAISLMVKLALSEIPALNKFRHCSINRPKFTIGLALQQIGVFFNKNHIFCMLLQTPLVVLENVGNFLLTFVTNLKRSFHFQEARIGLEPAGLNLAVPFLKIHFGKIITDKKLFELRLIIKKRVRPQITIHQILTYLKTYQNLPYHASKFKNRGGDAHKKLQWLVFQGNCVDISFYQMHKFHVLNLFKNMRNYYC